MKCPFQTKKVTIKGVLRDYSYPKDIETTEFLSCDKANCMAYKNEECLMIKNNQSS